MASEVESFTIDSIIKGYQVYKYAWSSFKCCTIAAMKELENGLLGKHPAAVKPTEIYTL